MPYTHSKKYKIATLGAQIFVGLFILLIVISLLNFNSKVANNLMNDLEVQKADENVTLQGPSRSQIEFEYNNAIKLSDIKAEEYISSIKETKVEWIAEVSNVKKSTTRNILNDIELSINGYSITAHDREGTYRDLVRGNKVKIKAVVSDIYEFLGGVRVFLDNIEITLL